MVNEIRQGDVYWLDLGPSAGSAPAGRHPCVVVQSDVFNRSRIATTVVCLITSNMDRAAAPGNVALRKGDARLPKPGAVNVPQVVTVDKIDVEAELRKAGFMIIERVDFMSGSGPQLDTWLAHKNRMI